VGTDIHLYVEVRKSSAPGPSNTERFQLVTTRWTLQPLPYYDTHGMGGEWAKYHDGYEGYDARNYSLFAILASVRNGRGFGGVDTGSGFTPILGYDEPCRGLPEDMSEGLIRGDRDAALHAGIIDQATYDKTNGTSCPTCADTKREGDGLSPAGRWLSQSFHDRSTPFEKKVFADYYTPRLQKLMAVAEDQRGTPEGDTAIRLWCQGLGVPEDVANAGNGEWGWFMHSMMTGPKQAWGQDITQDEVNHLVAEGRLTYIGIFGPKVKEGEVLTAAVVNAAHSHDAINRWMLVDLRAERFGIDKTCATCEGTGWVPGEDGPRDEDGGNISLGYHDFNYLGLSELLAYDWEGQVTTRRGVVAPMQYAEFLRDGSPSSWSGGVSGGNVHHISNEEMKRTAISMDTVIAFAEDEQRWDRALQDPTRVNYKDNDTRRRQEAVDLGVFILGELGRAPASGITSLSEIDDVTFALAVKEKSGETAKARGMTLNKKSYYTQVSWDKAYADTVRGFLEWMAETLVPFGEEHGNDNVRIVFGFDS